MGQKGESSETGLVHSLPVFEEADVIRDMYY